MREPAKVFTDLIVWQKAHQFVLDTYRYTAGFPKTEVYGLTSQFRRAAVSIPANIAEGFRKQGKADKTRFYNIAQGSIEECRYYLILSRDLGFGDNRDLTEQLQEVSKLLNAFAKSLLTTDYLSTFLTTGKEAMKTILKARNLEKTYQTGEVATPALRGVDLDIHAGEFTAIAGPSGSGKSTLLHILGGLDRPTRGEVWLEDKRIDGLSVAQLANLRLTHFGFVFQAYNLIPVLTAIENAAFVLELQDVAKKEREAKAMGALELLGIAEFADRRPNQLSGGQQQRVAVARALAADPKVILADEPTANLDSKTGLALIEHMKRLNSEDGVTFLFSTHDPRLLAHVTRTVYLEDGKIVKDSALQEA